jgi:3'(2'), 5'-bisphosphate nucleotidase
MSQVDLPFLEHADTRQAINQLMWEASDAVLAIYESSDLGIATKDDQSPVTKADLAAHHVLVTGLSGLTPDIPIVSEEDPESLKIPETHSRYWLIDPLDGTKEFIQRNGEFTCNLALIDSNITIYGWVSVPVLGLLYHGGQGRGAQRLDRDGSNKNIRCAKPNASTRVVTSRSHLNPETEAFIAAIEASVTLIQAGSSLKFLRIAEGAADLYPRMAPTCEWDTAAAQAVLEGAGGSVIQLDGSPVIYGKSDIRNPHFVAQANAVVNKNRTPF